MDICFPSLMLDLDCFHVFEWLGLNFGGSSTPQCGGFLHLCFLLGLRTFLFFLYAIKYQHCAILEKYRTAVVRNIARYYKVSYTFMKSIAHKWKKYHTTLNKYRTTIKKCCTAMEKVLYIHTMKCHTHFCENLLGLAADIFHFSMVFLNAIWGTL